MSIEVYSHRDAEEARQAVDLFRLSAGLGAPASVLDLACGTGRHAFEFARRGYYVTAADLSQTLLTVAHRKTQRFGEKLHLARADMRRIPFRACFDGVAQLFTAFGYFADDFENFAVMEQVGSVLKPGGYYMLDFLNADEVRASLRPESERDIPGGRVLEHRRITDGRIEKEIRITTENGDRVFHESVRLFSHDDLLRMLTNTGFAAVDEYGDYRGNAFRRDSPRCILVSRLNGC